MFSILGYFMVAVDDPAHVLYLLLLGICCYCLNSEGVFAVYGFLEVFYLVAHGEFGLQFYHPLSEPFL